MHPASRATALVAAVIASVVAAFSDPCSTIQMRSNWSALRIFFVVPQNMIAVPRNVIVVPQNMIAQNMIAAPQKNDSSAVAFGLPSSACPTAAYSFGAFAAKLTPPATPFSHRTLLRCPMLAGMRRRRSPRFQKAGPPGEGPPPSQKLG